MLSRQGFFRECLFKKLLTTRSFCKIPKNSEPHESQFKVFFRLRRKDVNSGFSGTKDHTTKRIMFKEHQARNQSFRVITKTLLFSSLILGGMLFIKGCGIPGQYQTKMMYLKARKYFKDNMKSETDETSLQLLNEEEYRLEYLTKNGMLTRASICSILINVVEVLENYSEMNPKTVPDSLDIICYLIRVLQQYNKEMLKDIMVVDILINEVLRVYTLNTNFPRLAKQTRFGDEDIAKNLMFVMLSILNFNKDVEFRLTLYAYLMQILDHNKGAFDFESEFANEIGIKHIALQTTVELCKNKSIAIKVLDMKLLSNLLSVMYSRDPECIEDIDNLLKLLNSCEDIKRHINEKEFTIERQRLENISADKKILSKYSNELLKSLLK